MPNDMHSKIQKSYHMHKDDEPLDNPVSVVSATECTGLIPSAPCAENEVDSYTELYDVPLSKKCNTSPDSVKSVKKPDSTQN